MPDHLGDDEGVPELGEGECVPPGMEEPPDRGGNRIDIVLGDYLGEERFRRLGVVAEPVSTTEVSALIRMAFEHEVPVTAGGARTGLSGGALAIKGGLVLSLRRMNKILLIDEKNHQVIVEPGLLLKCSKIQFPRKVSFTQSTQLLKGLVL